MVQLCGNVDGVVDRLCEEGDVQLDDIQTDSYRRGYVDRFRSNLCFVPVSVDDGLVRVMDVCRVADYVLFVLDATREIEELGEMALRCVQAQGISNVLVAVSVCCSSFCILSRASQLMNAM